MNAGPVIVPWYTYTKWFANSISIDNTAALDSTMSKCFPLASLGTDRWSILQPGLFVRIANKYGSRNWWGFRTRCKKFKVGNSLSLSVSLSAHVCVCVFVALNWYCWLDSKATLHDPKGQWHFTVGMTMVTFCLLTSLAKILALLRWGHNVTKRILSCLLLKWASVQCPSHIHHGFQALPKVEFTSNHWFCWKWLKLYSPLDFVSLCSSWKSCNRRKTLLQFFFRVPHDWLKTIRKSVHAQFFNNKKTRNSEPFNHESLIPKKNLLHKSHMTPDFTMKFEHLTEVPLNQKVHRIQSSRFQLVRMNRQTSKEVPVGN